LRIRVPSAKGNPAALEEIKRSLAPVPGVSEVKVSAATGTITVLYDPKRHVDFHEHLANAEGSHQEKLHVSAVPPPPVLSEVDEAMDRLEKEAEFLASHSHSAKALFDALRKATDNNVDLKVLAPLALAAYAFVELGFEAATPVWLTLGVFSFNHFVALHTQRPTTHPGPRKPKAPGPSNPL
jgi:cation transport ATPase